MLKFRSTTVSPCGIGHCRHVHVHVCVGISMHCQLSRVLLMSVYSMVPSWWGMRERMRRRSPETRSSRQTVGSSRMNGRSTWTGLLMKKVGRIWNLVLFIVLSNSLSLSLSLSLAGWEYTVEAGLTTPYVPFERNIHLSRRRRWVRIRVRDPDSKAVEKKRVSYMYLTIILQSVAEIHPPEARKLSSLHIHVYFCFVFSAKTCQGHQGGLGVCSSW